MLVTKEGDIPNILVVDDDYLIRMALNDALTDDGCKVYEAVDAEEAREVVRAGGIHIALVDNKLPGMSGVDLRKILMRIVPVIMISGSDRLIGVPSDDILVKPFDLDHMRREISRRIS